MNTLTCWKKWISRFNLKYKITRLRQINISWKTWELRFPATSLPVTVIMAEGPSINVESYPICKVEISCASFKLTVTKLICHTIGVAWFHTIWRDCKRWKFWTCVRQIWRWVCSHFNCASHFILLIVKIIRSRFCISYFPHEFCLWLWKETTPVGAWNTVYKRTRIQSTRKVSGIRAWSNLKNIMSSSPLPPDNIPLFYWNRLKIPTICGHPVIS